jgi:hypothetical protein
MKDTLIHLANLGGYWEGTGIQPMGKRTRALFRKLIRGPGWQIVQYFQYLLSF